jgi:hypothetical protein
VYVRNRPLGKSVTWTLKLAVLMIAAFMARPANSDQPAKPGFLTPDLVCTWTDGPRVSPDGQRCEGVVHCRRAVGYSFLPLVRKVNCPAAAGSCSAEECAQLSLASDVKRG